MAEIGIATVIQAVGAAISGATAIAAVNQNSKIAAFNQEVANDNAKKASENAQIQAMEQDEQARLMMGDQLNAIAGAGVSSGTGSARKNRIAAKEAARLDALRIRQAGDLEAQNFKNQSASIGMQNQADKVSGYSSALGSFLQAGTFIGGARKTTSRTFYPTPTPRPRVLA